MESSFRHGGHCCCLNGKEALFNYAKDIDDGMNSFRKDTAMCVHRPHWVMYSCPEMKSHFEFAPFFRGKLERMYIFGVIIKHRSVSKDLIPFVTKNISIANRRNEFYRL